MKRGSFLTITTAALCAFLVAALIVIQYPKMKLAISKLRYGPSAYPSLSIARANKIETHGNIPIPEAAMILLGDSIIELMPNDVLLRDLKTVNHGIRGDKIEGLLKRFEAERYASARAIVLMIGVNDLQGGALPESLQPKLADLVNILCEAGPPVYWLATLPVDPSQYMREILTRSAGVTMPTSEKVSRLNKIIATEALACDSVRFIETRERFGTSSGTLRPDFTIDGLHLSSKGLSALADIIKISVMP